MSCQICGQRSAPGAKLCADCRAARKRAYDATITQPLLGLVGAGTVSRTLSRLRRSDASPEAKARRAARKAQAAAKPAPPAVSPAPAPAPAPASGVVGSRSMLWALLTLGVVVAAIAGWYLPSRAPDAPEVGAASSPSPQFAAPDPQPARIALPAAIPAPAVLPPLPVIVERELVPHSPAAAKRVTPKRGSAAPKAAVPAAETRAEIEIVPVPPVAQAPPPPTPLPRIDPWRQMSEAIGRCPDGFLGRVVCEQKLRLQYCEGHWGQVPQCPGGPRADHD